MTLAANEKRSIDLVADLNMQRIASRRLTWRHIPATASEARSSSGFVEEQDADKLTPGEVVIWLLLKPFTADTFLDEVKTILGRG